MKKYSALCTPKNNWVLFCDYSGFSVIRIGSGPGLARLYCSRNFHHELTLLLNLVVHTSHLNWNYIYLETFDKATILRNFHNLVVIVNWYANGLLLLKVSSYNTVYDKKSTMQMEVYGLKPSNILTKPISTNYNVNWYFIHIQNIQLGKIALLHIQSQSSTIFFTSYQLKMYAFFQVGKTVDLVYL